MTWPEICDELVKRWPERFYFDGDGDLTLVNDTGSFMAYIIEPPNLYDMARICSIIGAVVWSAPSWVEGRHDGWYGAHEENDNVVFTVGIFPTRAEAELAALGAWLEATR